MQEPIHKIIAKCWDNKVIVSSDVYNRQFRLNVSINGKTKKGTITYKGTEVSDAQDEFYRRLYKKL